MPRDAGDAGWLYQGRAQHAGVGRLYQRDVLDNDHVRFRYRTVFARVRRQLRMALSGVHAVMPLQLRTWYRGSPWGVRVPASRPWYSSHSMTPREKTAGGWMVVGW